MRLMIIFVAMCSLIGCSGMSLKDYKNNQPQLNLQTYLNGNINGYGIVQDRTGNVTRRFDFHGNARWTDNRVYFDEKIIYDNGKSKAVNGFLLRFQRANTKRLLMM